MRNIINVLNWKDNENVKDKRKENVKIEVKDITEIPNLEIDKNNYRYF